MNLFILDECPIKAAAYNADRHVIKIILEAAQILSSVYRLQGYDAPYKLTHKNHPVTIWSRTSRGNFDWTVSHGLALCAEYTQRYGKVHKSQASIEWARDHSAKLVFDQQDLTPFAQAMPDEYKNKCAVTAYRNYYLGAKTHLFSWKNGTPAWVQNAL